MAEDVNTSPFCEKYYSSLGQHLYRCPERQNREYKSMVANGCPGCKQLFNRLDLHLKSSKSCHLFSVDKSNSILQPQQPQHSGSMDNAQLLTPTSVSGPSESFSLKPRIILPRKDDLESWGQADEYMQTTVIPSILFLISVDLMNETLNSRIYDYFKEHHDARECPYQEQHQRNHKPHLHSALAKVRRKKNELKKKFRQASKDTVLSKSDLAAMGKAFHDIVKQHSRLRVEAKRDRIKTAKFAVKQCTRNFWKFSENLLSSDDCSNDTDPSFGADIAFDFFSKTYATASNEVLSQPSWMPDVPAPNAPFHHDPMTLEEIIQTMKKCRCGSSPNPLPYRWHSLYHLEALPFPPPCTAALVQRLSDD